MRKKNLRVAAAAALFFGHAGCDLSQESGRDTRQFAPRLVAVPASKRIRVEIAGWDLKSMPVTTSNGNQFYRQKEVDFSEQRLQIDSLPNGQSLFFRVSGIDSTGVVTWSSSGSVPSDLNPSVVIGGASGLQPSTLARPTVVAASLASMAQITCPAGTWPAWTIDGSFPSDKNSSTRYDHSQSQLNVTLNSNQTLLARCTNDFSWSGIATYTAPLEPSSPSLMTEGTILPSPVIVLPQSFPGPATFTIDTATATNSMYSHWKIVVQINGGTTNFHDLANHSEWLQGSGTLSAYAMAWNGNNWVSGHRNVMPYSSSSGPSPANPSGPGTTLPAIVINTPDILPGIITFGPVSDRTGYSDWKVAYKLASVGIWEVIDLDAAGVNATSTNTIDAYLMAWSSAENHWTSGPSSSQSYPKGPTAPTLIGEGSTLQPPSISVPLSLPGLIQFSVSSSDPNLSNWMVAWKFGDTGTYRLMRLDSSIYPATNGKITGYLMAWSTNQSKWVSGPSSTQSFGQSPTTPLLVQQGGVLPYLPTINGTSAVPGTATITFAPTASDAEYTNWKVVYRTPGSTNWIIAEPGTSVPFNFSGNLSAYLEAWSPTNQQWVSGMATNLYVPTLLVVDPPVFKDPTGMLLDSTWLLDTITITLQIQGAGTIYFTTDGGYPSPGNSGTSVWDPSQKLTFPSELSSLTIRAVSVDAKVSSNVAQLVIGRPLWTRRDNSQAGCIRSAGNEVFACGDDTGPWLWDTTGNKWIPLDPDWGNGRVELLEVDPAKIVAATENGGVQLLNRTAASGRFIEIGGSDRPSRLGGLAIASDTLWASSPEGPLFYDAIQDTWATSIMPSGTVLTGTEGPAWSDGKIIWMAFGPDLWRYVSSSEIRTNSGWQLWNNIYSTIRWLGPDPFATSGAVVGFGGSLYQISGSPMTTGSNHLGNTNNGSVVQIATAKGTAYAAMDDGSGLGGVARASGWESQYWSYPDREWPSVSNRAVSSQGVVKFNAHGFAWLLSSTPQGTYTLRVK